MPINDSDILELIRNRQDLHVKFFSVLDTVRWRFTSAFGVGAAVGVLSGFSSELETPVKLAAQLLVVVLCLAGLISQIRVYSLLVVQWSRLMELQKLEAQFLREKNIGDYSLYRALASPSVAVNINGYFYYATVGIASCVVFAAIIGVAVVSILMTLETSLCISVLCGLIIFGLATTGSLKSIERYVAALERHPEETTI